MRRLALLRHGHTPWNRVGRLQGRTDIALDPEAVATLSALRLPPDWAGAALYSSPLSRARQTAALIAGRAPAIAEPLIEMNWGDWEGQHGEALSQDPASGFRPIEDWGWHYTPPGGESPAEVWARLQPWLATLPDQAVAVSHIGVMRVLLARAMDWHFAGPCPFRVKRNRLYILEIGAGLRLALDEPVRLVPATEGGYL
ncbi:histidine phosphatase family protein [bacterium]|nr:histidine phosphatase family protein [bacterium]